MLQTVSDFPFWIGVTWSPILSQSRQWILMSQTQATTSSILLLLLLLLPLLIILAFGLTLPSIIYLFIYSLTFCQRFSGSVDQGLLNHPNLALIEPTTLPKKWYTNCQGYSQGFLQNTESFAGKGSEGAMAAMELFHRLQRCLTHLNTPAVSAEAKHWELWVILHNHGWHWVY